MKDYHPEISQTGFKGGTNQHGALCLERPVWLLPGNGSAHHMVQTLNNCFVRMATNAITILLSIIGYFPEIAATHR